MKKTIKIGKPYIKKVDSDIFGKAVRLCAEVTMINPNTGKRETKECYFEFEKNYENYICDERSDAFVMGLLSSAMENGMDIEFEAPISEQLYYQLTTYYIPMVAKYNATYPMHFIKLIGQLDNSKISNKGAVATGCSGGVDSFYTIARHSKDNISKSYQLTHLVYNSSCTSDGIEERIKKNFMNNFLEIKNIAKDCDLKLIACYNNLNEFYIFPYKAFNMFYATTLGVVAYALQKLIGIYYESSGDPISEFNLDLTKTHGHDSQVFDVFTLSCMNTENLKFYSAGVECTRIEKEKYISDYIPAQKHLVVCGFMSFFEKEPKFKNCSYCPKCLRTMAQFYALGDGTLEKFHAVFDVEQFLNHKSKYIGRMIGLNKISYVNDMKHMAKINHVKIPFGAYVYGYLWYKPIKHLRKKFKNSKLARKIYYKLNLDYKLDGYRGQNYDAYKNKTK